MHRMGGNRMNWADRGIGEYAEGAGGGGVEDNGFDHGRTRMSTDDESGRRELPNCRELKNVFFEFVLIRPYPWLDSSFPRIPPTPTTIRSQRQLDAPICGMLQEVGPQLAVVL